MIGAGKIRFCTILPKRKLSKVEIRETGYDHLSIIIKIRQPTSCLFWYVNSCLQLLLKNVTYELILFEVEF